MLKRTAFLLLCSLILIANASYATSFPIGYIPFTSITTINPPATNGDQLIVGVMTYAGFQEYKSLMPLPSSVNEMFSDTSIELAPGQFFSWVYVPTVLERTGIFSACSGCTMTGYPGNIIPTGSLPSPSNGTGTMAFRINSPAAVPEPASLFLLGTGLGVIGLAARRRKK